MVKHTPFLRCIFSRFRVRSFLFVPWKAFTRIPGALKISQYNEIIFNLLKRLGHKRYFGAILAHVYEDLTKILVIIAKILEKIFARILQDSQGLVNVFLNFDQCSAVLFLKIKPSLDSCDLSMFSIKVSSIYL